MNKGFIFTFLRVFAPSRSLNRTPRNKPAPPLLLASLIALVIAVAGHLLHAGGILPATLPSTAPAGERSGASVFARAQGPREWSFPADHGRHDGFKTEWWYFTGNLRDAAGRRFGYQLTFFRSAIVPGKVVRASPWGMTDLYLAHATVTDVNGKQFLFKDRLQRGRPGLAWASDRGLDVGLLDWSAKMGEGGIALRAAEDQFGINLDCTPSREPVFQGPGGVNAKAAEPGHASYYYSWTRLKTAGTLTIGGASFKVEGLSWMDHEFSSDPLSERQTGWDWMGLHLADGSDLMIYRMRDGAGGTDYLSGTHITPDGRPHYLTPGKIALQGRQPWRSPTTGAAYPQEWKLTCAGLPAFTVRSLLPGQELVTPDTTGVDYFEGAAEVIDERGQSAGEGYLEMTGYAKPLKHD